MLYKVFAQLLPIEKDGFQVRDDGRRETLYKARLQPVGQIEARDHQAIAKARQIVPNPILEVVRGH